MPLALAACFGDETATAYGAEGKVWHLHEIDAVAFGAPVELRFPTAGRLSGRAPCNGFSAELTTPYPWFETTPIRATKRACAELPAERRFFAALAAMTLIEISGDTMILTNDAGRTMLFKTEPLDG